MSTTSSSSVEQELYKLFTRASEDLQKGQAVLATKESLVGAADRFIKLSRRFFDIYKLFEEEFAGSLDVVAAKSMLHFTRSCFIVSHVLLSTDWLKLRERPTVAMKMSTLPRRMMRRVMKRTVLKKGHVYVHSDEEYQKSGFGKVIHEQNEKKRNHTDELYNVAIGLKDMATKMMVGAKSCGLVNESIKLSEINQKVPKIRKMDLGFATQELARSHKILKDYYIAVIQQIEKEEQLVSEGLAKEGEIDSDQCLLPLMDKFGMKRREVLRGEVEEFKVQNQFLDVINSEADLKEVSRLIILLDNGPEVDK